MSGRTRLGLSLTKILVCPSSLMILSCSILSHGCRCLTGYSSVGLDRNQSSGWTWVKAVSRHDCVCYAVFTKFELKLPFFSLIYKQNPFFSLIYKQNVKTDQCKSNTFISQDVTYWNNIDLSNVNCCYYFHTLMTSYNYNNILLLYSN